VIVEIVTFQLAPQADVDAFVAADHAVQTEFVPNHRGFIRRTTARNADEWCVVNLWYDEECAEESLRLWESDPVMHVFTSFVAPGSLRVRRYEDLGG
jgi:hypothetical protein